MRLNKKAEAKKGCRLQVAGSQDQLPSDLAGGIKVAGHLKANKEPGLDIRVLYYNSLPAGLDKYLTAIIHAGSDFFNRV